MRRDRAPALGWILGLAAWFVLSGSARAQQQGPQLPSARLFTVTPAGGKAGTSVEVTIGGADLEETKLLYFNHPTIKAEPVPDPMKAGSFVPNKFKVTIPADTPIGIYDVRAVSKWGISNPRAFVVGDLNEVLEKEPNNDVAQAQKVELNSTIHGSVSSAVDVDYYSFAGKKGQRVLIACEASSIDSRLDPFVQLYASGRLLASNHRYRERDAVLDCTLPADGDYLVRVSEHAHLSGSPEHFYRLSISLAPWIDAAFPPVIESGKPAQVTLYGRNLPNGQPDPKSTIDGRVIDKVVVTVTPPADPMSPQRIAYSGSVSPPQGALDGFDYRVKNAVGASNPVLLTFAYAPVVLENEDNDTPEKAQTIPVPCELCGRIEKKHDRDWYTFTAKKGEVYTIEAFADRIGSPMDLYFELRRADKKAAPGEVDDPPATDIISPTRFYSRTDDPKTQVSIPEDGKYELMVSSRTADIYAGPRYIYRLSIRKDQPDFRLILMDSNDTSPDACTVRQGSSEYYHVYCYRNDGFDGEVAISVEGLPQGVTCPPQALGPGQRHTVLVVTAAADAPAWAGEIKIKGTATQNGAAVVREARGACLIWPGGPPQQGIPAVSRLSRSVCLAVREKAPFSLETEAKEIAVPAGATITTKVKINRLWPDLKAPVQLTALSQPTPPNAPQPPLPPALGTIAPDKNEAEVKVPVPNTVKPGVYNLVLRGTAQVPFNKDPMAKQKPNVNVIEPTAPIKVTVYKQVAEVTVSNPSVSVKAGTDAELMVKLTRQYGYAGEFKLSLVLPQGFQGVTAPEVTIPANMNEAKFVLKAAPNAAPATNPDVLVRATAVVDKITLTQDAKIAVAITK